jgi:hypothetical protein
MPLWWAMVAFLTMVMLVGILQPVVKRKLRHWRRKRLPEDSGPHIQN